MAREGGRVVAACLLAAAAVLLLVHGGQHAEQRPQPTIMYSGAQGRVGLTRVERLERLELMRDLRKEKAKEAKEDNKEPFHVAKKWTLATEEDDMNNYFDNLQVPPYTH